MHLVVRRTAARGVLVTAAIVAAALLTACGSNGAVMRAGEGGSESQTPLPTTTSTTTIESSEPPPAFDHRAPLPSCGTLTAVGATAELSDADHAALACLRSALATKGSAELHFTTTTVEGGAIELWVRIDNGAIEQYVDSRDSYGRRGWFYDTICASLDNDPQPVALNCHASMELT